MRRNGTPTGFASLIFIVSALVLGACVQPGLEDTTAEAGSVVTEQRADALSLVPADAALAIVVNDLGALDRRGTEVAVAFGAPHEERFLIDLVRDRLGGGAGIREDGALMVVFPDAASLIDDDDPAVMAFVAVDDYRAFVGSEAADPAGIGLDAVRIMDEPWLARLVEGYAVLSPDAELLDAYVPAGGHGTSLRQGVAELGERVLERAEISAVVNITAFAPVLAPHVHEDAQQFADRFGGDEGSQADHEALVGLYQLLAESFLRDAQTVVVGANLESDGVAVEGALNLSPESLSASFIRLGGQAAGLLDQLPLGNMYTAVAVDLGGLDLQAQTDWLLTALPDGGPYYAFFADTLSLLAGLDGLAAARYRAPGTVPLPAGAVTVLLGEGAPDLTQVVAGALDLVDGTALYLPPLAPDGEVTVTAEGRWGASWHDPVEWPDSIRVSPFEVAPSVPESYREAASQNDAMRWVLREHQGQVATGEALGVLTLNVEEAALEAVLAGPAEGERVSDAVALESLRRWSLQEGAFFELYDDAVRYFHPWGQGELQPWRPFAVFGHLAQHEVAAQIVLNSDAVSAVRGRD